MPQQISLTFTGDGSSAIDVDDGFQSMLIVTILEPTIDSAPSSISVSVVDAVGDSDIIFRIAGREVLREPADPDGVVDFISVPVPNFKNASGDSIMAPGIYTLEVIQGTSMGTDEFEIINPAPELSDDIPEDAPPAFVPGSMAPDGSRRWVFQDLMPGGLGAWVLPMNPSEMSSPPFTRELTARPTTASVEQGGRFHVFEDAFTPVEWQFSGYCPTKEMREQYEAFFDLNRRWYLHDHRGRAWKVTFQTLEMTPRLTQIWNGEYNDEGHDFEAVVLVLEREWVQL